MPVDSGTRTDAGLIQDAAPLPDATMIGDSGVTMDARYRAMVGLLIRRPMNADAMPLPDATTKHLE